MKAKTNTFDCENAQGNLGVFSQWATAKAYLCEQDAVLARLFELNPQPPQRLLGVFEGLLHAIVSQQISNKAAYRLWQKVENLRAEGESLLEAFQKEGFGGLDGIGLSRTKLATIESVVSKFEKGEWTEESLTQMSDEALLKTLTNVKGIGPWSAHSVLIFGLGRPDVCPLDDLGIRTALEKHYVSLQNAVFSTRTERNKAVKLIVGNWAPYRTVATLVLWHSLDNAPQ